MRLPRIDYGSSILALVASVAKAYGLDSGHRSLALADAALARRPRNVVLSVFDGMGAEAVERSLPPESFLRRNRACALSSVFPPTTTAAMTTFYTGKSPAEHGWLGWSLYLKEYGRTIDTFLDRDSYTKRPAGARGMASSLMPYDDLFERIARANDGTLTVYTVNPVEIQGEPTDTRLAVDSLAALFGTVAGLLSRPGEKLIFTYWPEPDSTMHETGPSSPESARLIERIDEGLESCAAKAEDGLFLVTADHGQTDVEREIDLAAIPEISRCLALPPFIESRALSFFLLPGREREFRRAFLSRFGEDFLLLPRRKFLSSGLLGPGPLHPKTEDFLGDYLALATGRTMLVYRSRFPRERPDHVFKGHHAGLRPEELMVPLVLAGSGVRGNP